MDREFVRTCHCCEEPLYKDEIQERSNARGYGYYIDCSNCGTTNVIQEIDLTREL